MMKLDNNFPTFDQVIEPGGYAWWYMDAISDDEKYGLTIIALIGSVFSPYYAWSGRHDPLNHCALNVALYGGKKQRWTMTERKRKEVDCSPHDLQLGPSALHWNGDNLKVDVNEVAAPFPSRVRGSVRIFPSALTRHTYVLDTKKQHLWRPIAPKSRVEVDFEYPGLKWSGHGYFDFNSGGTPLEVAFQSWDWMRANLSDDAIILYDLVDRNKKRQSLALRFSPNGDVDHFAPPPPTPLPRTRWWWIKRATQAEEQAVRVVKTLEDTPFYSRSLLKTQLFSEKTLAVHESLDLDRFSSNWVRVLLPVRMPRWWFS